LRHLPLRVMFAPLSRYLQALSELSRLRREGGNLRFGLPSVSASDIASQFYCERKVEFRYTVGRVRTPEMVEGENRHAKLVEKAIQKPPEQILREALEGKPVWASELFLASRFGGVLVTGKPDALVFQGGRPVRVVEYKFTGSRIPAHYHHVQARIYCLILRSLGMDTSDLRYAILLLPPSSVPPFDRISELVMQGTGEEGVFLCEPDWERGRRELAWALAYWRGRREAQPTATRSRCGFCEYRERCLG
jgi:CRISPR/Cas system-associated exonuclease Cas4 (RecB family)